MQLKVSLAIIYVVSPTQDMTPIESENYFGEVSTAAESGEDFSSEWFIESFNFSTIHTKKVVIQRFL